MFFNENKEIPKNVNIFRLEELDKSIDIICSTLKFKKKKKNIKKSNFTDDIYLEITPINKYILYYRYTYDFDFYKN